MARMLVSPSRLLLVLAAAILAAVAFASALPAAAQSGNGRVRIMHASPDTPAVDIFVNGQKAVTALAFPNNTGYISLPAGTYNVKVFVSPSDGTGTPALEADLPVAAGSDYTVLAVGRVGDASLALLPLQDNNATPAAGNAHVRLIHASPDAPAVDVLVAGTTTKVFSNIAFKEVGAYTPVPAGSYNLTVNAAGTDTVALSINGLALTARTVYTAVAVGLLGDGSLQVVPLLDAAAPAPGAPSTGSGIAAGSDGLSGWTLAWVGLAVAAMAGGVAVFARTRAR